MMMNKRAIAAFAITLCSLLPMQDASAQSFLENFSLENVKDVVDDFASKIIDFSIEGDWTYTGAAIRLESNDTLSDLAAVASSSTIEEKMNEQLQKAGIKPGSLNFQFNKDKTMMVGLKGKTYKGTYTYEPESGELKMSISKLFPLTAKVEVRSSEFAILFKADTMLSLVKMLSGKTNIKTLETACLLLKNYDGMKIGFNFEEQ